MADNKILKVKKWIILSGVALLVLTLIFCAVAYYSSTRVRYLTTDLQPANGEIPLKIDTFEVEDGVLRVTGWSFIPGESIQTFNSHIMLRQKGKAQFMLIPTQMQTRPDVTSVANEFDVDGEPLNYDAAGFIALLPVNKLGGALDDYEVFYLYGNNHRQVILETGLTLA